MVLRYVRRVLALMWLYAAAAALLVLALPAMALADVPAHPVAHELLTQSQLWAALIGAIVPLGTYVINHVGPWGSEPTKAMVLAALSALAAALYTALDTHVLGFNAATLQLLVTAVIGSFATHALVWRPSGIAERLGGGSNASATAVE